MNGENASHPRYSEQALKEKAMLQELNKKPRLQRTLGYLKLSGPGFMNAAFTLGAGSFASSVTLGAAYGYSMMWVPLYSFTFGIFFLALAARFVCQSETPTIEAQNRYHGKFFGTFATGLLAGCIASMTATIGVMDWLLFNNGMIARGFSEDHERLGRFDAFCGGLLPVTLVLSLVSIAFAEAFSGKPGIPTTSSELCEALMGVIPSVWIQAGFYLGVLAMVLSSMIGLSATCATSFYQSLNIPRDTKAWYHPLVVLAPQIGCLGVFFGKPVTIVVTVAAMQSLFNWISGNSWYLLGNDPRYLGKKVIQSRFFNFGILVGISILNIVFITFVMGKMGVWPE